MNPVVQRFIPLVSFLESVLGANSEIVLHDFSDPDHSIVDIRNGHVSGRSVGGPATDLALKILRQGHEDDSPFIADYISHSSTNKPLRSASLFIRDDEDAIVGMLCVNTDFSLVEELESIAAGICAEFFKQDAPWRAQPPEAMRPAAAEMESLSESTQELVTRNVERLAAERGLSPDHLAQSDRIDVIRELDTNGLFLLKGAVADVARAMDISEPSVYRYLQKIRKE